MRTRGRRVALAAVAMGLLAVGGAAAVSRHRIREEYWILRLGRADPEAKAAAARRLAAVGSDRSVRPLLAALVALDHEGGAITPPEKACGEALRAVRRRLPERTLRALRVALAQGDAAARATACTAAGWWIGPDAAPLVPPLAERFSGDPEFPVRRAALLAMGRIGSRDALPHLLFAFRTGEPELRHVAVQAFAWFGRDARVALDALVEALEPDVDDFSTEGFFIGRALAAIVPDGALLLVPALGDPSANVRRAAVYALWEFRDRAKPTLSALRRLREDLDPNVRELAERVLSDLEAPAGGPATDPER